MKKVILLFLIIVLSSGAAFACSGASHADSDEDTTLLFETILDVMSEIYLLDMQMTPVALEHTDTAIIDSNHDFAHLLEMLIDTLLPDASTLFDAEKI